MADFTACTIIRRGGVDMRYYLMHNGKKVYFEFSLVGFKAAQLYIEKHGLGKRRLYVEV